jgi:YHS domain-containing protein
MLNAATALVFLPSLDVEAQTFSAQRTEASATSGTSAEEFAANEKSAVQRQLDAMYSKFGRKPEPVGRQIPTEHIAGNPAAKAAPAKAAGKVENAVAKGASEVRKSPIRQVAAEDAVALPAPAAPQASAGPRKLIQRPTSRSASTTKPSRRFFPSLFPRRKSAQPENVKPGTPNLGVQDHLKKLYEKDGREMPPMELNQLPAVNTAQAIPPLPNPALAIPHTELSAPRPLPRLRASILEAQPESQPIRTVSNNPFKRLIQRISPFKRKSRDPKPVAAPPEAIAEQRELEQGVLNPYYKAPKEIQSLVPPPVDTGLQEPAALAPAAVEAVEETLESGLPEFTPLIELPEIAPEVPAVSTDAEPAGPPSLESGLSDKPFGAEESADPPADPYPALSEQAADIPEPELEEAPKLEAPEEENPFTGLTLEAPAPAEESKPDSLTLPSPNELLPSQSEPKVEQPKLELSPELPAFPSTSEEAPKLIVRPESKPAPTVPEIEEPQAKSDSSDDPIAEKLKKIAERAELQGLKGFCPVQLRDERELRDARPQFSAEYEGATYNFSSAAALRKFQAKPYLYAPASSGEDVVLTAADNERVEGSLDHAVWYRDRLYLFQELGSLKSFVASPAKYAEKK